MVLSRGMIGSTGDQCEPKVACPFHKKTFLIGFRVNVSSDDDYQIKTYAGLRYLMVKFISAIE